MHFLLSSFVHHKQCERRVVVACCPHKFSYRISKLRDHRGIMGNLLFFWLKILWESGCIFVAIFWFTALESCTDPAT
jgi:hypothetical protein